MHRAAFLADAIVGLRDDRFIAFKRDGRLRIGGGSGEWKDIGLPGVTDLAEPVADPEGLLVGGRTGNDAFDIFLFGTDGTQRLRWRGSGDLFTIISDRAGRFALTRRGSGAFLVPLLPSGGVGPEVALSGDAVGPYHDPPALLIHDDDGVIVCRARDQSKAHYSLGRCWREGEHAWSFSGQFSEAKACGDWIVVVDDADAWQIAAYSRQTGKVAMQHRIRHAPALACDGQGLLFVGERDLTIFSLPSERPVWRRVLTPAPIAAIGLTEKSVIVRAHNSPDVLTIARPL